MSNRVTTNYFQWRGQFSPELVEALLSKYANRESIILDPFVGCGTTLFESVYQSLTCFGVDVNPSACELSRTAKFANVPIPERLEIIKKAEEILLANCPDQLSWVKTKKTKKILEDDIVEEYFKIIFDESEKYGEYTRNYIYNVIMRYNAIKKREIKNKLFYAFNSHKSIILRNLPYINNEVNVFNNDARKISLDNSTIDLIITSPPYINVFNYHQYYREVIELYRNDILKIAKSEIGSNRKNRENRFFTVIQYCLDMYHCFNEMKRLLKPKGKIFIVIGKESKIMNIKYNNSKILITLAVLCSNLKLVNKQKRQFITRFGQEITEDILQFQIENKRTDIVDPREVGKYYLFRSLISADVFKRKKIAEAIEKADEINQSPLMLGQT